MSLVCSTMNESINQPIRQPATKPTNQPASHPSIQPASQPASQPNRYPTLTQLVSPAYRLTKTQLTVRVLGWHTLTSSSREGRPGRCRGGSRFLAGRRRRTSAAVRLPQRTEGRAGTDPAARCQSPLDEIIIIIIIAVIIVYLLTYLSLSLVDRWGTKDDRATTVLHSSLFSAFRRASPNFNPVHSVTLSSHLFFCLPLLLPPCTVPCRIIFASPVDH